MNNNTKLIGIVSVGILLAGCADLGQQASTSERMKDAFGLTSASDLPASQVTCVTLVKPFTFKSGSVTYSLPAGQYKGTQKNSTGYFYYASSEISPNSFASADGIYINNQFTQGNLFNKSLRFEPIRGTVLPHSIFSYLKKEGSC